MSIEIVIFSKMSFRDLKQMLSREDNFKTKLRCLKVILDEMFFRHLKNVLSRQDNFKDVLCWLFNFLIFISSRGESTTTKATKIEIFVSTTNDFQPQVRN